MTQIKDPVCGMIAREDLSYEYAGRIFYFCSAFCREKFIKSGWSIGSAEQADETQDLYNKLEYLILPTSYQKREEWIRIMQHCIAINGSFFNTHRMVQQYVLNSYFE